MKPLVALLAVVVVGAGCASEYTEYSEQDVPPSSTITTDAMSPKRRAFSRNLNTGGRNELETDYLVARQRVYHSPEFPSHLSLSVVSIPR